VDTTPRFSTTLRLVDTKAVVVKIARDHDVVALRCEANMLAGLHLERTMSGVVRLVATGGGDGRFGLATAHAGVHTLHTLPTPSIATAPGLACEVFTSVAELHACGVTHGRIQPAHVVIGPTGLALLCGLRSARPLSSDGASADVGQAAAVCSELVSTAAATLPRRNRGRHLALADACLAVFDDHRLGAASMAERLAALSAHTGGPPRRSLQTKCHLVGQQPTGHGQHQSIAIAAHEPIEHPGHVVGS
jgi:hypothetical protein